NTVAIMVILLLPPVLAFFGGTTSRRRMAALAGLTLLVLATVFVTGSRGAWLGLGGGVVVTAVVWLVLPGHIASLRSAATRLPMRRGPALILSVLFMVAAAIA